MGTYYAVVGSAVISSFSLGLEGVQIIGSGVAVVVGIAGAGAIYYLGEKIDEGWSWLTKQIFR